MFRNSSQIIRVAAIALCLLASLVASSAALAAPHAQPVKHCSPDKHLVGPHGRRRCVRRRPTHHSPAKPHPAPTPPAATTTPTTTTPTATTPTATAPAPSTTSSPTTTSAPAASGTTAEAILAAPQDITTVTVGGTIADEQEKWNFCGDLAFYEDYLYPGSFSSFYYGGADPAYGASDNCYFYAPSTGLWYDVGDEANLEAFATLTFPINVPYKA